MRQINKDRCNLKYPESYNFIQLKTLMKVCYNIYLQSGKTYIQKISKNKTISKEDGIIHIKDKVDNKIIQINKTLGIGVNQIMKIVVKIGRAHV